MEVLYKSVEQTENSDYISLYETQSQTLSKGPFQVFFSMKERLRLHGIKVYCMMDNNLPYCFIQGYTHALFIDTKLFGNRSIC